MIPPEPNYIYGVYADWVAFLMTRFHMDLNLGDPVRNEEETFSSFVYLILWICVFCLISDVAIFSCPETS